MKKELITQRSPKSPIAETFRTLRTNLQFMNSQKDLKTILITSTMPGEGKSWISSNLAVTFAQAGKKVILVDADMRKGRLATMFSVNSTPGLSNYLSGVDERGKKIDILKYVTTTEIDNLYIIPSGNVPPNPSELLASEKTEEMLEKLKKTFDIVILDGTPALLVTDALILARLADTTTIVTAYKSTKKEDLAKVIINKIPIKPEEYKSTYYYGSTTSVEPTRRHQKADYQFETTGNIEENKKQEITEQLNEYLKNK